MDSLILLIICYHFEKKEPLNIMSLKILIGVGSKQIFYLKQPMQNQRFSIHRLTGFGKISWWNYVGKASLGQS